MLTPQPPRDLPENEKEPRELSEDVREPEDLWSPEYSEAQRASVLNMVDMAVGRGPEEEKEKRDKVVETITKDSLAHLGYEGVEIPTDFVFTPEIFGAIGWASAGDKLDTPETLQSSMEQRLKDTGLEVDPAIADKLGLIAYTYLVASWRGGDGMGREGYNETDTARDIVDRVVATVAGQEGTISADDIVVALSETNIRIGKKGLWEKTSKNTQELISMILAESAKRLGGRVEQDDKGKPFIIIGAAGQPVARQDLADKEENLSSLESEVDVFAGPALLEMLKSYSAPELKSQPIRADDVIQIMLVSGIETPENWEECDSDQRGFILNAMKEAAESFPGAIVKDTEEGPVITAE